jgi:hypothetical protein
MINEEIIIKRLKKEFRANQLLFKTRDICSFNEGFNQGLDTAIQMIISEKTNNE